MKKFVWLFPALFLFQLSWSQKEPVLVTDLLRIKTAGNISISKDGSKAVFALTSIEPAENSKDDYSYVTQIYSLNTDGQSKPVQLTYSRARAAQPAISPDGKSVAFVRVTEGKPQIFILPLSGGEPWQLTSSPYGAGNPHWSPDGQKLVYAASISLKDLLKDSVLNAGKTLPTWSTEKSGLTGNTHLRSGRVKPDPNGNMEEIRAYLDKNAADQKATVISKLNFQDEGNISTEISFSHFFIIDVQKNAKATELTPGFFRYAAAEFIPNSQQLVIAAAIDSLQHPDRVQEAALYLSDGKGKLEPLVKQAGMSFSNPSVSPSGKWLAYQASTSGSVSVPYLMMMPLKGQSGTATAIHPDRNASNLTWSGDEKFIYFTVQTNGGTPLYRYDISNKKTEALTDTNSGINSFDLAGNRLVFAKLQVSNPSEVFVADAGMKQVQQVSDFNDWVKNKQLSYPEKHSFVNEKGLTVEYWVMKPAVYQQGKKYPLLLEIHGGPSAMWGPGEASMWHEFQYFCSRGYGVVYSNPRGSGGYGETFLRANINDWGKGPASDVLTALDKTVAEGWADTSKLLITGGSYAGYLVAWIIAHDQRFKAACSQRGVYDLATFFGEGNAWRLVPNYFGGYPWEPTTRSVLQRESPINYVDQIRTPYIIFHGDNDRRTGFVQSEMLYRSLKVLGRPVEYVRHPGATHEITRSGDNRQRIDQMLRTYEFFERWIR